MTILCAIPYFDCADYIDQAVDAVLAQTYDDLVCLVAGDGEVPPVRRSDERLVVIDFPTNEGAPLTQQAMLLGSPFEWYAAHGADDWTEPEYLEQLMALRGRANGSRALWHEYPDHQLLLDGDTAHVEFGVFDAALLRELGGYGIDRRCGQDTLLYVDILPHATTVAWAYEPAYHKRIRAGSLTNCEATGWASAYRTEVAAHNADVKRACERIGWADREAVRAYRERLATPEERDTLAARVETVRSALGQSIVAGVLT